MTFQPGHRVRMSSLGRTRHPRYAELEGMIVGPSTYPSSVRVKFDSRKQVETFHRAYLESVVPVGAESQSSIPSSSFRLRS